MPAKRHRVTRGDDFRNIVRSGIRVGGAYCITHAVLHVTTQGDTVDQPARFGFIVSKAIGNAVTRNRVRRRCQAIVDARLRAGFGGADVVFRLIPAATEATFAQLEKEMNRSLDRVQSAALEARL